MFGVRTSLKIIIEIINQKVDILWELGLSRNLSTSPLVCFNDFEVFIHVDCNDTSEAWSTASSTALMISRSGSNIRLDCSLVGICGSFRYNHRFVYPP